MVAYPVVMAGYRVDRLDPQAHRDRPGI